MVEKKPTVYRTPGGQWNIRLGKGRGELRAWHQSLQGAIYEAIQLFVRGYRDRDITGKKW